MKKLCRLECLGLQGWSIRNNVFEYLQNIPENLHHPLSGDIALQTAYTFQLPLTSLSLEHCYEITNESLRIICQTFPRLAELCLSDSYRITHEGMECISSLKELRSLKLPCLPKVRRGRINYNDIGVSSLASSGVLSRLKTLQVVNISDESIDVIAHYTRHRSVHIPIAIIVVYTLLTLLHVDV